MDGEKKRGRSVSQCLTSNPSIDGEPDNLDLHVAEEESHHPNVAEMEVDSVVVVNNIPAVPPDGGWGWMVVLASFLANMVVDGISFSFGVFLNSYASYYGTSKGATALAGSLVTGTYMISGPLVGGLVNAFGSRKVMMAGSLVSSTAFLLSYWAPQLIHFLLLYGLLGGFGFGLIYLPAIVHVGSYFERKRAIATGIAVSGSGVGASIFGPLGTTLLEHYGWKGTHWLFSGIILNCAVFGALLRPLTLTREAEEKIRLLKEKQNEMLALSRNTLYPTTSQELSSTGKPPASNPISVPRAGHKFSAPSPVSHYGSEGHSNRPVNLRVDSLRRSECSTGTGAGDGFGGGISPSPPESPINLQHQSPGILNHSLSRIEEGKPMSYFEISDSPSPAQVRKESNGATPLIAHQLSSSPITGVGYHRPSRQQKATDSMLTLEHEPHNLKRSTSRTSRVSVRSFVYPFHDMQNAFSEQSVISSGCNLEDVKRPMSRSDIFYSGSLLKLHEYKESKSNLDIYRQSAVKLPTHNLEDQKHGKKGVENVMQTCREMFDFTLLRNPSMLLLAASNFCAALAFYIPFIYIVNHAVNSGVPSETAAWLLSITGIFNTIGRVVFGWISDRNWVSALTINNASLFLCGILTLICPFLQSFATLAVFASCFGFFVAAYICLTSIILVDIFGLDKLTNSFGLLILFRGIAALIGSPLAGAIYDATSSYTISFVFAGLVLLLASFVSTGLYFYHGWPCRSNS